MNFVSLLYVSRSIASLADQIMLFIVPVLVYKSTGSVIAGGIVFAIEWLPRIFSLPLGGTLVDRIGFKPVYLSADVVRALISILTALVIFTGAVNLFFSLCIYIAVSSFCYAQAYVSLETMIPSISTAETLPKHQSHLQLIEQGSMIAGPLIGGALIYMFSPWNILLLVGACYMLSFLLVWALKIPLQHNHKPLNARGSIKNDFLEAIEIIIKTKNLRSLIFLSLAFNLIFGVMMASGTIITTGFFDKEPADLAMLLSVSGFCVVLTLLLLPIALRRIDLRKIGLVSYFVVALCAIGIGFWKSYWIYFCLCVLIYGAGACFNIYIRTERARLIPKEHLGKCIGMIIFLNQMTLPISGLLVSLSSEEVRVVYLFNYLGALALIAFFAVQFIRHYKNINVEEGRSI